KDLDDAMLLSPAVFAPLLDPRFAPTYRQALYAAHNRIALHTWGDDNCCLPRGATQATLKGTYPALAPGDAPPFAEVLGRLTGKPGDADPEHRQVVRLTSVLPKQPPPPAPPTTLTDPLTGDLITEIEWAREDRLRFALCISDITDAEHGSKHLSDV